VGKGERCGEARSAGDDKEEQVRRAHARRWASEENSSTERAREERVCASGRGRKGLQLKRYGPGRAGLQVEKDGPPGREELG
jgi:hypothetical protein